MWFVFLSSEVFYKVPKLEPCCISGLSGRAIEVNSYPIYLFASEATNNSWLAFLLCGLIVMYQWQMVYVTCRTQHTLAAKGTKMERITGCYPRVVLTLKIKLISHHAYHNVNRSCLTHLCAAVCEPHWVKLHTFPCYCHCYLTPLLKVLLCGK